LQAGPNASEELLEFKNLNANLPSPSDKDAQLNLNTQSTTIRSILQEGQCCVICQYEFEAGEILRILPCLHFYHVPCIDMWLKKKTECPLCKHIVAFAP
jgi:hypothetical protein